MRRFDAAPASAAGASLSLSGTTIDDRRQVLSDSEFVRRNYCAPLRPHHRIAASAIVLGPAFGQCLKHSGRQQPCNYRAGSVFLHLPPVFTID
jgi:hypothetical protein